MPSGDLPSRPAANGLGNASTSKLTRSRKSKGRSKGGCLTCKQKRVKCDEKKPICGNCLDQSRNCLYDPVKRTKAWQDKVTTFSVAPPVPPETPQLNSQVVISPFKVQPVEWSVPFQWSIPVYTPRFDEMYAPSTSSKSTSTLTVNPAPQSISEHVYDAIDSQLLAHFITVTSSDLIDYKEVWVDKVVPLGFQQEFLMHAILMCSASHLEKISPDPKPYTLRATFHLYQALASYRQILREEDFLPFSDAIIATSFLLVIQAAAAYKFDPLNPADDRLLSLGLGISSIVQHVRFESRINTFKRILTPPLILPPKVPTSGPAFRLIMMIDENRQRHESSGNYDVYMKAIARVTPMVECATEFLELDEFAHEALMNHFIRWQSFISSQFVALVSSYDPDALVIMAHFYAALDFVRKRCTTRRWWWYEERPWSFCSQVFLHLGSRYATYMSWPMDTIAHAEESPFMQAERLGTPINHTWATAQFF